MPSCVPPPTCPLASHMPARLPPPRSPPCPFASTYCPSPRCSRHTAPCADRLWHLRMCPSRRCSAGCSSSSQRRGHCCRARRAARRASRVSARSAPCATGGGRYSPRTSTVHSSDGSCAPRRAACASTTRRACARPAGGRSQWCARAVCGRLRASGRRQRSSTRSQTRRRDGARRLRSPSASSSCCAAGVPIGSRFQGRRTDGGAAADGSRRLARRVRPLRHRVHEARARVRFLMPLPVSSDISPSTAKPSKKVNQVGSQAGDRPVCRCRAHKETRPASHQNPYGIVG
jgi:hypothetical protein